MQSRNEVWIDASPATVYQLAAEIEFWPAILPHYRYVRILRRDGGKRLVKMGATRDGWPVSWTSIQWLEPDIHRITFRHVGGVTRGMAVEWAIVPGASGGVDVTIAHRWEPCWPLVGSFAAERIIGPYFVHNIAGKTLERIKEIAEGGSLAGRA
ncbi:MAG: SRPBCC family protein [Chloroflexi bacterium]|nr:SRPBCC family protein [Chloroflexota bacterium]